jgi:methyl-accepting chemotaxis protein
MKLEHKLGSTCGITILAMLITSTVAYVRMTEVDHLTSKVVTERSPVANTARDLRDRLMSSSRALEDYMLFGVDPTAAANFRRQHHDYWEQAETSLASLTELNRRFDLGPDNARIQTIDTQMKHLKDVEDQAETLIASQKPDDMAHAYDLVRTEMAVNESAVYKSMMDLVASENSSLESESQQVLTANKTMMWTLWVSTIISSLLGGALVMIFARRISRNVRSVVERAKAIAQGDLSGAPLQTSSADEIDELAQAIQQMQANLRQIISTVAHTASSVTGNAVSIGNTGNDIHRKMDEQNQQTELTVAAVKEMSLSVLEVSRHASSAAENARAAAETARQGGNIVSEMLESMNSIADAVSSTSHTIHLLGEDSGRISHIVNVIEEIARDTNLLALNAAIEAARAGEQGRGFAVVAGEVRRLAENTAQATNEISQMIRGIQERTSTAVASMAEGTVKVETGMQTTSRAGEALQRIIGMAEQVDNMIAQIAVAAQQQTTTASHSSSALHSIYQLGSENLSAMTSSVASAESLRNSALELEGQIERFRIADNDVIEMPNRPGRFSATTRRPRPVTMPAAVGIGD